MFSQSDALRAISRSEARVALTSTPPLHPPPVHPAVLVISAHINQFHRATARDWTVLRCASMNWDDLIGGKERGDAEAQLLIQLGRHPDVGQVELADPGLGRGRQQAGLGQRQR